jgi:hypothetical protein
MTRRIVLLAQLEKSLISSMFQPHAPVAQRPVEHTQEGRSRDEPSQFNVSDCFKL